MLEIHLTVIPPSVNSAYGNNTFGKGKGRYKKPRYTEWERIALTEIKPEHKAQKIKGYFVCHIIVDINRWRKNSDIDNRQKLVLDLLKTGGVITDDKFCRDTRIRLANIVGGGMIIRLDDHDGSYETITPEHLQDK